MIFNHLLFMIAMLHLNTSPLPAVPAIPFLGNLDPEIKADPSQVLKVKGAAFPVSQVNWAEFPHCPDVKVFAGYTDEMLWLNFSIKNDYMRVHAVHDQELVYEDTCVEFFMHTGGDYRNFEFNCLGVCRSATGPDRHERTLLPDSELKRIVRIPSFSGENLPEEGEICNWELTVGIPLSLLGIQAGTIFFGNFYKCGAKTKVLHYLSWAPIRTRDPNFHCPEFFSPIRLKCFPAKGIKDVVYYNNTP